MAKNLDPHNINSSIAAQIASDIEHIRSGKTFTTDDMRRVNALYVMVRVQYIFMKLRGEKQDDTDAGTAVRKYATDFAARNAIGRRAASARPAAASALDELEWLDDDSADGGDGGDERHPA